MADRASGGRLASHSSCKNRYGEWVPAIPLPFYGSLRKVCSCKRKFWTSAGYRAHYALVHILGLD